jgi:glycosyltransferase involved in cell wall biosynthesis
VLSPKVNLLEEGEGMNILVLASWYPNEVNNISGVFIREQAEALARVGINVIVLFPYDKSIHKKELSTAVEDGILTYRANTDYMKNTKVSRIKSIFESVKLIDILVKKHEIDLIHAHVCYSAGFAAAFYRLRHHVPFIITEHMSYISKYNRKMYNRFLFKYAYGKADRVIPVSNFLQNEMRNMGFDFESTVVGNTINNIPTKLNRKIKNINECNILFVGLMSKNKIKGLEYLIPAFKRLVVRNSDIKLKLHFAGNGEMLQEYMEMCNRLMIMDNVVFHGKASKKELEILFNDSDFLVLSSIKETFGSVLIEAMAHGLPVLATRCGGPQDFINEKVGLLVEAESIDALENGLQAMLDKIDEFDSEYIRAFVEKNFSGDSIGNKLKEIYVKILKE